MRDQASLRVKALSPLHACFAQVVLRGFFRSRDAVCRALGKQNYMINPKRCLCPFISKQKRSKCKEHMSGTVELNRLNDLSNFWGHLVTCSSDTQTTRLPRSRRRASRLRTATPR